MAVRLQLGKAQQGKKPFGLQIPNKAKPAGAVKPVNKLFTDEDDEEPITPAPDPTVLPSTTNVKRKTMLEIQQALQEDPSVFDYDEVLPQIREQKNKVKQQTAKKPKTERKSQYIDILMEKAENRKWENERARENQILKQIEAEKEIFGEKKQYTTRKYKEHLIERKIWEEQQEKNAIQDEDVTKKKDLSGFYYAQFQQKFDEPETSAPIKKQPAPVAKNLAPTDTIVNKTNNTDTSKNNEKETATLKLETTCEDTKGNVEVIVGTKRSAPDPVKKKEEPVMTREEKIAEAKKRLLERKRQKLS